MEVKILEITTDELRTALIQEEGAGQLPSMHNAWRFNFAKQLQKLSGARAYVLVTKETPAIIEGCMIFQMKDKILPYINFIEVAPHNRGKNRKYDRVAGCLIAFAFKQSLLLGKGDFNGFLAFDVLEETEEETKKLIRHYSSKYNAKLFKDTRMVIIDKDGEALIEKYLPDIKR